MKFVVIEDEKFVASNLADCVHRLRPQYQLLKILPSVSEAIEYFKSNSDYLLIFSDINLGDGMCFEIFEKVDIQAPIIFCTAFEQYSIEAFNTNGIDFILKPFEEKRIEQALQKFEKLSFHALNQRKKIEQLSADLLKTNQHTFLVNYKDRLIPKEVTDIAIFYIRNESTFIVDSHGNQFLISETLEQIEHKVGDGFYRANRQYLVNRKYIKDVSRQLNRTLSVNLAIAHYEVISVSKEKSSSFLKWLKMSA